MNRIAFDANQINFSRQRYWVIAGILVLTLLVLVARLAQLQLLPNQKEGYEFLQQQAVARQVRYEALPASRGLIVDRNDQLLAVSVDVVDVWVNPTVFSPSQAQLASVAKMLNLEAKQLASRLTKHGNKQFLYLSRQLSPDYSSQIKELGVKGIYASPSHKRFYPAGEVTSQILGVTNIDQKGLDGVELLYDQWLSSEAGKRKVVKDLNNNIIQDMGVVDSPKPGNELQLTLDMRVQYYAYKALKEAVAKSQAKSAQSIVIDVKTGDILAMVSQPSFNPNDRKQLTQEKLRNRVVSDLFEPGSTMKPLTALAAFESGKYNKDSILDTNPGTISVERKVFIDPVNYGWMDIGKILQKSSQVGTVQMALALDDDAVISVFQRLGLGIASGIGFASESSGSLPNKSKLSEIEKANLSFGYGLEISAIQLAKAYGIIANDGKDIELRIAKSKQSEYKGAGQIIEPGLARSIRSMLVRVTEKGGTSPQAAIAGYRVAGKSGTTHKVDESGYDSHNYRAIFVGMAPADNPQIVTVVVIDNPISDNYSGGTVAAPVFADITSAALRFQAMVSVDAESVGL